MAQTKFSFLRVNFFISVQFVAFYRFLWYILTVKAPFHLTVSQNFKYWKENVLIKKIFCGKALADSSNFIRPIFIALFFSSALAVFSPGVLLADNYGCRREVGVWLEELEKNPQNHIEAVLNIQSRLKDCNLDLEKDFGFSIQKIMELRREGAAANIRNYVKSLRETSANYERDILLNLLVEEVIRSKLALSEIMSKEELKKLIPLIKRSLSGYKFKSIDEQIEFYKLIF